MGNDQVKKELKTWALITPEERAEMIALLQEYIDVFTWSYEDKPSLDTDIRVHRGPRVEGCKPVKQKLRKPTQMSWSKSRQKLKTSEMLTF